MINLTKEQAEELDQVDSIVDSYLNSLKTLDSKEAYLTVLTTTTDAIADMLTKAIYKPGWRNEALMSLAFILDQFDTVRQLSVQEHKNNIN